MRQLLEIGCLLGGHYTLAEPFVDFAILSTEFCQHIACRQLMTGIYFLYCTNSLIVDGRARQTLERKRAQMNRSFGVGKDAHDDPRDMSNLCSNTKTDLCVHQMEAISSAPTFRIDCVA